MTTVWLANTASLLLPVSNLTNLLAADRVGLKTLPFARQMALPQLAALSVVTVALWVFYWRSEPTRYEVPPQLRPRNPRTFALAGVCTAMFIGAILAGVSIAVAAVVTAALLTLGFVRWDQSSLTWNLVSWRLLVFVTGLFLVVDTIGRHGLSSLVSSLIGTGSGGPGIVRAAAVGTGLSNTLNNLPAYVAGEAVIPVANHHQLIGLLIGTNVGPVITPWASLATLIWAEHCRHAGVTIHWRRFMATGALTAAGALAAAVAVLIAMRLPTRRQVITGRPPVGAGVDKSTPLLEAGRRPGGVGGLEPAYLVVGQPDLERGGVGQVARPGRADDGRGRDRVLQHPGERHRRHRHAAFGRDLLYRVGDRLFVVRQRAARCTAAWRTARPTSRRRRGRRALPALTTSRSASMVSSAGTSGSKRWICYRSM
jgi:hypothetical protein